MTAPPGLRAGLSNPEDGCSGTGSAIGQAPKDLSRLGRDIRTGVFYCAVRKDLLLLLI